MVRRLRRIAWVATPLLLLLAVASSAHAAEEEGRIDHVEPGGDTVKVAFSLPGLDASATPDLDRVAVTADGDPVEAKAELATDSEQDVERITVLAIDVSSSMRGDRFEAAKEAAQTYIELAPSDVQIGLVTFASEVQTLLAPTTDHDAVLAEIDALTLTDKTRLYDGVLEALDVAGTEGVRSILLLSDGKDRGSEADLETTTVEARESGVRIDAVALEQNEDTAASLKLKEIAEAAGGDVTQADVEDLQGLYAEQAVELENQIIVTFPVPEGVEGDTTLTVSVEAAGDTYVDSGLFRLTEASGAAPSYEPTAPGFGALSAPWLIAGLTLLFAGAAAMLAMGFTRAASPEPSPLQKQMQFYTVQGAETRGYRPSAKDAASLRGAAVAAAGLLVRDRDLEERLGMKLDRAGLKLTASEWVLVHVGSAVLLPLAGLLLTGGNLLVILLCLAMGIVLPWLFLSFQESRRIRAFNSQLAQTLQIVAGALQAGLSLAQAVDTVVHDGSAPVSEEFRRAIIEQRLGVSIEDALDAVADRMESRDFKWVVMAIRIQRQVGGNLAELILTVAATLREREYLRRQVSVLSAEGRLSAWILGGLPILFFGYLALMRPEYLQPMLDSSLGLAMLGLAGLLLCAGGLWLRQTVKVEV
jgi:tight adherence protein B